MPTKIILLGSQGIVGSELIKKLKDEHELYSFTHSDLDITNKECLRGKFNDIKPDTIINAAAYTDVEDAEINQKLCYDVNYNAVTNIAQLCKEIKAHLVHFSTDYVFDGKKNKPYLENDISSPLNTYGDSKNKADETIKKSNCRYTIFRTSWVYGSTGSNFVKKILEKALKQNDLDIVSDQYGSPTSSNLIAEIIQMFISTNGIKQPHSGEVFNLCPSGSTSWYEFAKKIINYASRIDRKYNIRICPIRSYEYKSKVNRPNYTVLSNQKLCSYFDIDIQNWEHYLESFLKRYIK